MPQSVLCGAYVQTQVRRLSQSSAVMHTGQHSPAVQQAPIVVPGTVLQVLPASFWGQQTPSPPVSHRTATTSSSKIAKFAASGDAAAAAYQLSSTLGGCSCSATRPPGLLGSCTCRKQSSPSGQHLLSVQWTAEGRGSRVSGHGMGWQMHAGKHCSQSAPAPPKHSP